MCCFILLGLPIFEGALAAPFWGRRSRDARMSAARFGFWCMVLGLFVLALTGFTMLAGSHGAESLFWVFSFPLALMDRIEPGGPASDKCGFSHGMAGFLLTLWL